MKYKDISRKNRDSSMQKCHTLTISIIRSKAKRTHFIHVYVKTGLPQHKKVYHIIWLSGFWALENPKVEPSLLTHMPPYSEFEKVKKFILSKSGRVFISHHFGPFPDEKYSKLTILDHFW